MNASELRIGNWIHNNVEPFQIQAKDLIFLLAFDNEHYANPIPLNKEWVLNFGFSKMRGDNYTINKDGFIFGVGKLDKPCDEYGWCFIYYNTDQLSNFFQYVHQLQNLYYALTGGELTIST